MVQPLAEQSAIRVIMEVLETLPTVLAAVVYGSVARGHAHAASDIDVALLFPDHQVPDPLAALELAGTFAGYAKREVDLLVLNGASPIIAFQAVKYGQVLMCRDQRAYRAYVSRLITEYADLKITRRPIEDAVLKRRIYG